MNIKNLSRRAKIALAAGILVPVGAGAAFGAANASDTPAAGNTQTGSAQVDGPLPKGVPTSGSITVGPATDAPKGEKHILPGSTGTYTSTAKVKGPLPEGVQTSGSVTVSASASAK